LWIFTSKQKLLSSARHIQKSYAAVRSVVQYDLHIDPGSSSRESYRYPVVFALLPDKKETFHFLLTLLNCWGRFWSPKIIKVDFAAAIIAAINKVFQTLLLLSVIFVLASACGDKYKIFRLTQEYKETEQVDSHAECVLLINKVEEGRLMIMENVPQSGKLPLFLDYCVQQWLENRNVPIEVWSVNKHRYRAKSAGPSGRAV